MHQQEDERRFRQHQRALEDERKKAEADKEQRRRKLELTKRSPSASGSVADEKESVRLRRKLERSTVWAE